MTPEMSAREAAKKSAEFGDATNLQDAVDMAYEAIQLHQRDCRVCGDGNGNARPESCGAGEALYVAWGCLEEFRDSFRRARK